MPALFRGRFREEHRVSNESKAMRAGRSTGGRLQHFRLPRSAVGWNRTSFMKAAIARLERAVLHGVVNADRRDVSTLPGGEGKV